MPRIDERGTPRALIYNVPSIIRVPYTRAHWVSASRTERLFIAACVATALGMEDGRVPNSSISASAYIQGHEPQQGRLRVGLGWRPYNAGLVFDSVWFQVKFAPEVVLFTHVATQGGSLCFVREYSLALLMPERPTSWLNYTVNGVVQVRARRVATGNAPENSGFCVGALRTKQRDVAAATGYVMTDRGELGRGHAHGGIDKIKVPRKCSWL